MNQEPWQSKLCDRVRDLRRQSDLSQMEFASQAGLSHHTIGKIERREVFPTLETLLRLSEAHKIPMADFFSPPTKGSTAKERALRDLMAIMRRHDERRLDIALGLLKYLLPRL